MQNDNSIMKYESVLPEHFDGTFRFSNWSDEDFVGKWNSKEYLFPAQSTVPMIMADYSPLEIQHIRKKFAKDLAVREFGKSKDYKVLANQEGKPGERRFNSIHQAAVYNEKDLESYIKRGLDPLEEKRLTSKPANVVKLEDKIHRNDDGSFSTEAIDKNTSLRAKAQAS